MRPLWLVMYGKAEEEVYCFHDNKAGAEQAAVEIARRDVGETILLFELVGECTVDLSPPQWERKT